MSKVKILLFGEIGQHVNDFVGKLSSLQRSKAGPFDACFCVGRVDSSLLMQQEKLPIPVYCQDASGLSPKTEGMVKLACNLYAFTSAQVYSVDIGNTQLVVASCPPRFLWDSDSSQSLQKTLPHVSYVGCDLLLTGEWPQGISQVLPNFTLEGNESYDVAQVALHARARYHVAPSVDGEFVPSPPFFHLKSSTSTFSPKHTGRFLAMAPVLPASAMKDKKRQKFVYALGIVPLQNMTSMELSTPQDGVLPNPFTDESYKTTTTTSSGGNTTTTTSSFGGGLSEAQARRLIGQDSSRGDSHGRWQDKRKREYQNDNDDDDDNSENTVLFVHGLHKDTRGVLQRGNAALLRAFSKFKVEQIQRPPGGSTSFCFCTFSSHELAKQCLEETGGSIEVEGVELDLKWARNKHAKQQPMKKKQRLMEADAMDSTTLYYKFPISINPKKFASTSQDLRVFVESTLEKALGDPNVTAATEPALQVKLRHAEPNGYGFLEFASHAAASMVLATLTSSCDGGVTIASNDIAQFQGLDLYWARNPTKKDDFKFQRKHFPADSRQDCWFCLASPDCERHLIVSIHDKCYIAIPKGAIHKGHVLIVPVAHSSKGALVDVAQEMELLVDCLRKHASEKLDMDLFVFERAIQTKGGYHTHVQCIPVERGLGIKLQTIMLQMAKQVSNFDLREINSDLALSALLSNDDDDDDENEGYFYAQVPVSPKETKRYLYKATGAAVPLQFGREVLAQAIGKPERAHWKACVVDEEQETSMTAAFRESFAPFAPPDDNE